MASYQTQHRLSAREELVVANAAAELKELQRKKAERVKRCEEDPIYAAQWLREQKEKTKNNKGIRGSRWADDDDPVPEKVTFVPVPTLPGFSLGPTLSRAELLAKLQPSSAASISPEAPIAVKATAPAPISPTTTISSLSSASPHFRAQASSFVVSSSFNSNTSPPVSLSSQAGAVAVVAQPPARPLGGIENSIFASSNARISSSEVKAQPAPTRAFQPASSSPVLLKKPETTKTKSFEASTTSPIISQTKLLRIPKMNTKPDSAAKALATPQTRGDMAAGPTTSTYIPPHLQQRCSSAIQPTTAESISQQTTLGELTPTLETPQTSVGVSQVTSRMFAASNMRNGINIRECAEIDFFRHGENAPEPESDPPAASSGLPWTASDISSLDRDGRAQPQASPATLENEQAAENSAAATTQPNDVSGEQVTVVSPPFTITSIHPQAYEMPPAQCKQLPKDQTPTNAKISAAQASSGFRVKIDEAEARKCRAAQPASNPSTSGVTRGISKGVMKLNEVSNVDISPPMGLTAVELLFLQAYVKPNKLPHQLTTDEYKNRVEYQRLVKLQALSEQDLKANNAPVSQTQPPRAFGIVSTNEFMASCQGHSVIANKYGAPKKATTPPMSGNSSSRKSNSPSAKTRRSPLSINPFMNPAWNLSTVDPGAFMAHVNARVPDGKGKTYSGKAINQPESEDFMSTRRPGTQVWTDTVVMGKHEDTSLNMVPKQEIIQPALKENSTSQKSVEQMALDSSHSEVASPHSKVAFCGIRHVLPHLRRGTTNQNLPPQNKVETTALAPRNSKVAPSGVQYILPHLRCGTLNQNGPPQSKVETATFESKAVSLEIHLPPFLRGGTSKQKVCPQIAVGKTSLSTKDSKATGAQLPLAPHLRDTVHAPKQILPPPASAETTVLPLSDVKIVQKEAYILPHLRPVAPRIILRSPSECNSFRDSEDDVPRPKENIRATQGNDPADQLLDFDGSWNPPPCDWDTRVGHDNSYVSDYIKEWSGSIPVPSKIIDTTIPEFRTGECIVVDEDKLESPPVHTETLPADEPENENIRTTQTAEVESHLLNAVLKAKREKDHALAQSTAQHYKKLSMLPAEPNLFCPKIEIYLRPATTKDLAGIAKIYNYYVNNSIIPEDQENVTVQDIDFLLQGCKANQLPFLVAVQGKCPATVDAQGRKLKQVAIPQHEHVLGFAFAQVQAFGLGAATTFNGRSRTNANLHLYVQHDFQKQGIGRNLLDRLLLTMNQSYTFRNGADWINPYDDLRFIPGKTADRWHKLFFHLPVDKRDETESLRTREFLAKFFFCDVPEARLINAVRTSKRDGTARFADLVIFSKTCLDDHAFPPFV